METFVKRKRVNNQYYLYAPALDGVLDFRQIVCMVEHLQYLVRTAETGRGAIRYIADDLIRPAWKNAYSKVGLLPLTRESDAFPH